MKVQLPVSFVIYSAEQGICRWKCKGRCRYGQMYLCACAVTKWPMNTSFERYYKQASSGKAVALQTLDERACVIWFETPHVGHNNQGAEIE